MNKTVSLGSALLCTFIWGTTFIAQETGMQNIGPYVFNGVRFFVGFLALIPFYLLLEKKNTKIILSKNPKRFLFLSISIGIFLFLASVFQQVALLYTDVANAAFFTIFYVPMVPIIVFFLFKKSIHWSVWPSVLLCLMGGYLLTNFHDATVRLGDTHSAKFFLRARYARAATRQALRAVRQSETCLPTIPVWGDSGDR